MALEFSTVLVFALAGLALVLVMLVASNAVNPRNRSKIKSTAYECAEVPFGDAWSTFNIRFYLVVLIFIIFDLELAFVIPVATVLKKMAQTPNGLLALAEILFFVAVLALGLVYVWAKGDINWIKTLQLSDESDHDDQ